MRGLGQKPMDKARQILACAQCTVRLRHTLGWLTSCVPQDDTGPTLIAILPNFKRIFKQHHKIPRMDLEGDFISKMIPTVALLVLGVIEAAGGLYFHDRRSRNDFSMEIVSMITLPVLVQPGIFLLTFFLAGWWFPNWENHFVDLAFGGQFLAFLLLDDMLQYWWHRWSHSSRIMWKLHRPHHLIEEMGVLMTYRNALLYYALMPGIWFSAVLIYLGMGYTYLVYLPIKITVILLAHSETKWDRFLYRTPWLHPLAWVIERTISTPSTHFAHHGLSEEDGISHPNGNFGNLLFLWDILFGTAKITRRYPTRFGAWNRIKEPWYVQIFFPILRAKDPESELHSLLSAQDHHPRRRNREAAKEKSSPGRKNDPTQPPSE